MADSDYLIEIVARLKDEASDKIAALKAQLDELKGSQDVSRAQKDLERDIGNTGKAADKAKDQHKGHTEAVKDSGRAAKDTTAAHKSLADSHEGVSDAVRSSSDAHKVESDTLRDSIKAHQDYQKTLGSTGTDLDDLNNRYATFNKILQSGSLSAGDAERGLKSFRSEFQGAASDARKTSQDYKAFGGTLDEITSKLKSVKTVSDRGIFDSLKDKDIGGALDAIGSKIDGLSPRLSGLSSFIQGFKDVFIAAFAQPLLTGMSSLAGSLISVGSAAAEAGAALGGVFISGIAQIVPMVSVAGAALLRLKSIFQAVSINNEAEISKVFEPNAGAIKTLQNQSQLISSNQQLANSQVQVFDAQQRVIDSQINLTEARKAAIRNITDLELAERSAKLAAEGASISLEESRRQLQVAIEQGNVSGISSAELAIRQAELGKRKADIEVPRAEQDARVARARGVSGNRSVVGAAEGLKAAQLAVTQAHQATEAARREMKIVEDQMAQPSSKETSSQSKLKMLIGQMSAPEKVLFNVLKSMDKELKSPNSPLKKITDYFVTPFSDAATKLQSLLHNSVFIGTIDNLAKSMGASLKRYENAFVGIKGTNFFETMSNDAAKNLPVVTDAIIHLMHLFEDIAKAADPAFHKLSEDWDKFWGRLDKEHSSAAGLKSLEEFFNRAVTFAEGFAHLGKTIGDLFLAIGHDAAPQGLDTVKSFSGSIEKATQWVQSHGPEVTKFFREAREGLSAIGTLIFTLGKSIIEVFSLSSLKAFTTFIDTIILPVLRDIVNILGKIVTIFTEIINKVAPLRVLFEGLAGAVILLIGFAKVYSSILKVVEIMKTLRLVTLSAWAAFEAYKLSGFTNLTFAINAAILKFKELKAAALGTAATVEETSAAEVASLETVGAAGATAGVEAGAGGAAVGAGGAGLLGTLGAGAARFLGPIGIAAGTLYGLHAAAPAETSQKAFGLPSGDGFGQQLPRALNEINPFGGHFLSSSYEESSQKLGIFGTKVEELRNKISTLSKGQLETVSKEATSLSENSSLSKFKGKLEEVARAFSPTERGFKEFSENIQESLEKLSAPVRGIKESFEGINISTGRIWANIKGVLKENIESIKENLGLNSRQGKEALAKNFDEAKIKIEESMTKGTTATSIGMGRIKKLVSEALKKYGISDSEITGTNRESVGNQQTGPGHHKGLAAGGYIPSRAGGTTALVGEAGHDEVVLTTDPRHKSRQRDLLGQYLSKAPHMAEGGMVYQNPLHGSITMGRTDQGVDADLTPGSPITAIGESKVKGIISNWYEGQPYIWAELLNGPDKGKDWYVAEQINRLARVGQVLQTGQPIAYYAPSGTGIEIGWSTGGGQTLAQSTSGYTEGNITSAGASFRSFLTGLQQGKVVGSNVAASIAKIAAPIVKGGGAFGSLAQNALNIVAKAANLRLEKAGVTGTGETTTGGKLSGSGVGAQIMNFFTGKGLSRAQSAGIIGNFMQESSLNPNEAGGGLDQGQGSRYHPGNLLTQLDGIWSELTGSESGTLAALRTMKNAREAALLFSQRFERPGEPDNANRERYAEEALGKYASGGRIAPWGGKPIPIIAHEGERIMNPSQYRETARLAGTSEHGLDSHLGFNTRNPKQTFDIGGAVAGAASSMIGKVLKLPSTTDLSTFSEEELSSIPLVAKIFKQVQEGFKKINKGMKDNNFLKIFEEFVNGIDLETTGALSRLEKGREFLKTKYANLGVRATYRSGSIEKGIKGGEPLGGVRLGPGGTVTSDTRNIVGLIAEGQSIEGSSKIATAAMSEVRKQISETSKMKNSNARTTALNSLRANYGKLSEKQKALTEAMDQNIESRYQLEAQRLQDQLSQLNSSYSTVTSELTTQSSKAQSFGQYGSMGGIEQSVASAAKSQISSLEPILKGAEASGNTELANSIKQEIQGLRQTVTNSVVEQISAAESLIQQEASSSQSKSSMLSSFSKLAAGRGDFQQAGNLERESLGIIQSSLASQRSQIESALSFASREGDTAAMVTLTNELNKNSAEISENSEAIRDSATVTRELIFSNIEREGAFTKGIYGAASQGLEILGKTTGVTNVKGLLSAAEGESGALGRERSSLEGQAGQIGLGRLEGLNAPELLNYMSSSEGQALIGTVLAGQNEKEKEYTEKLIASLEQNAIATDSNAQKIAELNGHLNQPQSWSTEAWKNFRSAYFNGMGNLLPQYSSVLPPGAMPTEMPTYGSASPGASNGPFIGNLNLTHPVEKFDPQLLGEELSYHIGTTPAA